MMVMDTQGAIHYLTNEAKCLMALACQPLLALGACDQEVVILAKMAQLCRNLEAIFNDKHAAPPSWCHVNGRGRFTFRACWLEGVNQEMRRMISMTIEHQEPLNLKILRALQNLPLSPAQKQVAFLVAQGYSNEQVGLHLHIKLTTVKEHVGKIFDKLGLGGREEILSMLMAVKTKATRGCTH